MKKMKKIYMLLFYSPFVKKKREVLLSSCEVL